jgi:Uma2 family endonuclease
MASFELIRDTSTCAGVSARVILHEVPWAVYTALRDAKSNDHLRMTYLDGNLEVMSPEFLQEKDTTRLDVLIRAVARAFGIPYQGAGSTTLRRRRRGIKRGHGREPDASFYFHENAEMIGRKSTVDLTVDPPPDLAIEVDNTADSAWKLPVFARLGVPEVWRYDVAAGTLWFGRLGDDRKYASIESSRALPMLTRTWVLDALNRGRDTIDSRWETLLAGWIRDELLTRESGHGSPRV